jgi:hypothetical protein
MDKKTGRNESSRPRYSHFPTTGGYQAAEKDAKVTVS